MDKDPSSVASLREAPPSPTRGEGKKRRIHSQTVGHVVHPVRHHHRATDLTKAKRTLKWQRDPEGMRLRILEAAKQEFAAHGIAGARVDRIAAKAGANKRMLYYHVGKKDDLYLAVLEGEIGRASCRERV